MNGHDDRHPDELISALFDGELAPEEWTAVKDHLERCPRCRRLLEQIKSISAAMPPDPPVPEGLAARVKERLPAGAGRQRPSAPRREPIPYKPARRRITFPLAAGAGLAAALIVGVLVIQYVPSSMLSRLRLPPLAAEDGAESSSRVGPDGEKEQESASTKAAPRAAPSAGPEGGGPLTAEFGADASAGGGELASAEVTQETIVLPPEAKGDVVGTGAGSAAAPPPTDFAAAGEQPGLAPGQELPVTVPEEADEPARSAEEIALDAVQQGPVGGVEGAATAAANELQVPAKDGRAVAKPAQEAGLPPAAAKVAAAPTAAPPPDAGAPLGRAAEAAPVAPAASVAECRATWGSQRQASWRSMAGGNPERAVGAAGKAAGGKSIILENPRRVRITVTRDRWPELMRQLASAGVTGTAQLPAPPEWADCAAVNVSVPESPTDPPAPAAKPSEAPPTRPPGT
jgi:hypothetical protein